MMILDERKQEKEREVKEELERHCLSWLNNHMTVVLMAIQSIHGRSAGTMAGIEFFLHDIEHHFVEMDSARSAQNAFRYLKRYFQCYPRVSARHSPRAVEMVKRIYTALGFKLILGAAHA